MDRPPERLEVKGKYNFKMSLESLVECTNYKNDRVKVTTSCESGNK
jgi:hypothetical protein